MVDLSYELQLLYAALSSKYGLIVNVDDFTLGQAKLYKARREAGDPRLNELALRRSPRGTAGEIWIVRNSARLPSDKETS